MERALRAARASSWGLPPGVRLPDVACALGVAGEPCSAVELLGSCIW